LRRRACPKENTGKCILPRNFDYGATPFPGLAFPRPTYKKSLANVSVERSHLGSKESPVEISEKDARGRFPEARKGAKASGTVRRVHRSRRAEAEERALRRGNPPCVLIPPFSLGKTRSIPTGAHLA
jgi:hypothetical protein